MYRDETKNLRYMPLSVKIMKESENGGFRASEILGMLIQVPIGCVLRAWIDVDFSVVVIGLSTDNKLSVHPLNGFVPTNPEIESYELIFDNQYGNSTAYRMLVPFYN